MTVKILIVEDDAGLVMALSDLLHAEGYEVETALTGPEGLERASAEGFDLIILDVMLPGKNGFDVARDLRARKVDTPILMLTARGQVIDKVLGLKLGADDTIELSAREFQLLRYFIEQRGATLTREQLLREVWGYEAGILTRTVDVHVSLLRQKLEDDAKNPRYFLTMRGHGYKFVA
ncbi:MAG: DNA-binding response regulator [Acidobacteria bacterium]|nr:MAG: DNA-binding response regulator [Acidobacteriota bacterium]